MSRRGSGRSWLRRSLERRVLHAGDLAIWKSCDRSLSLSFKGDSRCLGKSLARMPKRCFGPMASMACGRSSPPNHCRHLSCPRTLKQSLLSVRATTRYVLLHEPTFCFGLTGTPEQIAYCFCRQPSQAFSASLCRSWHGGFRDSLSKAESAYAVRFCSSASLADPLRLACCRAV